MIGESTIIKQALAITLCIAQIGSGNVNGTAVKIKEAEKPLIQIESLAEEKVQQTVVEEIVLESLKEPAVYVPQAGVAECVYCGGNGHDHVSHVFFSPIQGEAIIARRDSRTTMPQASAAARGRKTRCARREAPWAHVRAHAT